MCLKRIYIQTAIWGLPWQVQWLRFHTSNAGGVGLIIGWGTKIPHAMGPPKNKKKTTASLSTILGEGTRNQETKVHIPI